jgi:hypothetical protein
LQHNFFRYSNLIRIMIGYGVPLTIVCLTLAIAYAAFEGDAYSHGGDEGDSAACWLQEDTFIWTFTGPAAFVIIFNFYVLTRYEWYIINARLV